jgi:hypothetical protein
VVQGEGPEFKSQHWKKKGYRIQLGEEITFSDAHS